MRLVTSLFISGIISSTSIGALTHYLQTTKGSTPEQAMKQLFEKDRPAALRLLKQTTFTCVPALNALKSTKARDFFPKMMAATIDMAGAGVTELTQENKDDINYEIQQLLRVIPDEDSMVLAAVGKQLKAERETIKTCMVQTLRKLGREALQKDSKQLSTSEI